MTMRLARMAVLALTGMMAGQVFAVAPTVTTSNASLITSTTARLNGSANPNGLPSTGWFRFAPFHPGACDDGFGTRAPTFGGSAVGAGVSGVAYFQGISGLSPGVTYYYCAIAQNQDDAGFGEVLSFTTPSAPTTTTGPVNSVTNTTAGMSGSGVPNGAASTGWFRYGTVHPGTCHHGFGTRLPVSGGVALGVGTSAVPYSFSASALAPSTTYYYCAIVQNSEGTGFGAVLSFMTSGPPTVTTTAATNVFAHSATLNGNATPMGDASFGYFRYGTSDPGLCHDNFGARTPTLAPDDQFLGAGPGAVPFSSGASGLAAASTYYYCAVARNSYGTSFGNVLSFTTPSAPPSVVTNNASVVTSTSAQLNGVANPNGAASSGWFRYSATNPGTCDDSFGTRSPGFGGTLLGAGTSGVAYTQGISGLSPAVTYYFCAIAQNMHNISFGTLDSFTTAVPQFTLSYGAGANGSISGASLQTVNQGASGSAVDAVPSAGYHFVQWSDASTANPRTDSNVTSNLSVTASFANDAPTIGIVDDLSVREDSGTTELTISVDDLESAASSLLVSAASNNTALILNPDVAAGQSAGERVISLAPVAQQHGGPVTITLTIADPQGASSQRSFAVMVTAVNDAPTLTLATPPVHAAATVGVQSAANFASVDFGPADEDASQSVDDFLISDLNDPLGVLVDGGVDIHNDGTLVYELSGVGGIATAFVRVRDSGGIGNGGVNTSAFRELEIRVAPGADLQIAKTNHRAGLLVGESTVYAIVVANAGPNDVSAATLTDTLPETLVNGSWICVQAMSTATCPTPNSGVDGLNASVDLGVNQYLRFDVVADVDGVVGGFVANTATIVAPEGTTALNTGNDTATDQDPIVPIGLMTDGFETSPALHLSVPGAPAALRSQ